MGFEKKNSWSTRSFTGVKIFICAIFRGIKKNLRATRAIFFDFFATLAKKAKIMVSIKSISPIKH